MKVSTKVRVVYCSSARSRYKKGRRDSPPLADLGLPGATGKDQFENYCSRFRNFISEN